MARPFTGQGRGVLPRPIGIRLVEKIGAPDEDGCWPWLGRKNTEGYGVITIGGANEHVLRPHRVAYELLRGVLIPEGLTLDHLCRNRACVNPEHLEPVTIGENVRRGAVARRSTHCVHGHEFTLENTRIRKNGRSRECITCSRKWATDSYTRNRDRIIAAQLELQREVAA